MSNNTTQSRSTHTANANPIRRNLFSGHLSRRPNSSSTTTSATTTVLVPAEDASDDVVVRNQDGGVEMECPELAGTPVDEEREEREAENRLIETYRQHQQQCESNELRMALEASLQAKVASLDEDKWMFEGDDTSHS